MKFLIDTSKKTLLRKMDLFGDLILGQLITPLTRYSNASTPFGVDNGAFTSFREERFKKVLKRDLPFIEQCLFVAVPDVVGNAAATMELWKDKSCLVAGWPAAFVAQDGSEGMQLPWDEFSCLFIGGKDPWKESQAVLSLIEEAKKRGKHVHIGRVNTYRKFSLFSRANADTCDGSGIARYDHMLEKIAKLVKEENGL